MKKGCPEFTTMFLKKRSTYKTRNSGSTRRSRRSYSRRLRQHMKHRRRSRRVRGTSHKRGGDIILNAWRFKDLKDNLQEKDILKLCNNPNEECVVVTVSDDIIQFLNNSAEWYRIGHLLDYLRYKGIITLETVKNVYKKEE